MTPGRELDALIATKIMGWHIGGYHDMEWVDSEGRAKYFLSEFGSQECTPFEPSYDIASAWEVVSKLTEAGYGFSMSSMSCGTARLWVATFEADSAWEQLSPDSDTAPHAICLAALKATDCL